MSNDYRILLAIDLKVGTDRLAEEAQRFASALDAIVDILHVAAPDPDFVGYIKGSVGEQTPIDVERDFKAKELRDEHRQAQAIAETLRQKGVKVDRTLTLQGELPTALFEHVRKLGSDLLIVGAHHHSALARLWYGDVAVEAVKLAPCALLVVPL